MKGELLNLGISKHSITICCIIFLAFLDIITRNNASLFFEPGKIDWVIKGVLGLTYCKNYGGLLGFARGWKFYQLFSIVFYFLALVLAFVYYSRLHKYLTLTLRCSFILFTASFLGGLPDHIFLGYTRDWIVWFGPGVANLDDTYFFISLFLFFLGLVLHPDVTWKGVKRWL